MKKKSGFSDHDDFEQFDDSLPKADINHINAGNDEQAPQDAYRMRQSDKRYTQEPQAISDADLRRKINTRAITYLSRREYSRSELKNKLLANFEHYLTNESRNAMIEQILNDLERGNWLSDARYAAQITKVKGERFGLARLKHEFKQKGLDEDLVQQELVVLKTTELERAQEVWLKKFGNMPTDLKEKARQVRFMASRGFGYEILNKIFKNLDEEN